MTLKIKATKPTQLFKQGHSATHEVAVGEEYEVKKVLGWCSDKGTIHVKLGHGAGDWLLHWADWATSIEYRVIPTYFSQRDNYRDPQRTCFSSTCAMLLKYYKPNAIRTDDEYLTQVFHRGDSTSASVQLEALRSFGLDCEFSQRRSIPWLVDMVEGGNVVAIGLLHNGPWKNPKHDSGHYILVYGHDPDGDTFLCHDPAGLPNTLQGGFLSHDQGDKVVYPADTLAARWCVEGPEDGWALSVR